MSKAEALRRIKWAAETGATVLDLSGNQLTELLPKHPSHPQQPVDRLHI
jgi:hypothetical protein